jgi:DNA-binding MarR family transcriptional regulator
MKKPVKSRALTEQEPPADDLSDTLQELLSAAQGASVRIAKRMAMGRIDVDAMQHLMGSPLTVTELAAVLGVTPAAATQLADRLEIKGHIQRIAHDSDARKILLEPSPQGIQEVVGHLLPMLSHLSQLEKEFSQKEKEAILKYLEESRRALDGI